MRHQKVRKEFLNITKKREKGMYARTGYTKIHTEIFCCPEFQKVESNMEEREKKKDSREIRYDMLKEK